MSRPFRSPSAALLQLGLSIATVLVASPAGAAPPAVPTELQQAVQAYRLCIAINLPADLPGIHDAESAAQLAAQRCADRRLEVAGQYALVHPGARDTRAYVDGVTVELVTALGMWVEDVNARRESPNPARPRTR